MNRIMILLAAVLLGCGMTAAAETVVVAGAGPSTAIVTLFFEDFGERFEAKGFTVEVPQRSIKHAGGIRTANEALLGRTGRPLTDAERGDTLAEIPLARIPLAFVIDPDMGVGRITRAQLEAIYSGEVVNWREFGGADAPIRLIGREAGEAAFSVLVHELPCMEDAAYVKRLRKDHQVVTMLETEDRRGMLAFGAADNFDAAAILEVEGFATGVAVGLVYHVRNSDHPLIRNVAMLANSDAWRQVLAREGYLPVD